MFVKKVNFKRLLFALVLLAETIFRARADSYEFVDRDIHEILYALSMYTGISISADDTVSGKADFRSMGEDFNESFDAFLLQSRLYVEKKEKRWTVSRIRIQKNLDLYSLDAFDVNPLQLFEKAAIYMGLCVTYDNLPQAKLSLHTNFCKKEEILKRICELCMGFSLEKQGESSYHVARSNGGQNINVSGGKAFFTKNEENGWNIDVANSSLASVVEKFCSQAEKQFRFVVGSDLKIARASFKARDFDSGLSSLCMQAGAECKNIGGVYFISPSKNKNQFSQTGKKWNEYKLCFLKGSECESLLAKRFPDLETMLLDNAGKILFLSDSSEDEEVRKFLSSLDVKKDSRLISLKYLRTQEFLAHLPPFIDKNDICDSGRGDSFFFTGSEESYQHLLKALTLCDKPVSRVRYDLLIMQYQSTEGSEWNPKFTAGRVSLSDMNDGSVQLGSVLNLNLDVVGAFGLHFAGELQTAISQSRAKVFADTTLNGVSGKSINFQNTNTYRYRDNNLDPQTGKPVYSGVTKEISSGLKLEITGTVTGDSMITTKITASVSRQGSDLSTITGNPPPTSEKVITTEVRAKSGEPVVLSGLVQEEENENLSRVPLISKIPLIGSLFTAKEKSREKTELVIYLLPQAESFDESSETKSEKKEKIWEKIQKLADKYACKKGDKNER